MLCAGLRFRPFMPEAEALHKRARATSFRRLATGGAVALAAVGIGLGMHLGLWEPQSVPADQQDSSLGNERSDASVSPEADTKSGSAEAGDEETR